MFFLTEAAWGLSSFDRPELTCALIKDSTICKQNVRNIPPSGNYALSELECRTVHFCTSNGLEGNRLAPAGTAYLQTAEKRITPSVWPASVFGFEC